MGALERLRETGRLSGFKGKTCSQLITRLCTCGWVGRASERQRDMDDSLPPVLQRNLSEGGEATGVTEDCCAYSHAATCRYIALRTRTMGETSRAIVALARSRGSGDNITAAAMDLTIHAHGVGGACDCDDDDDEDEQTRLKQD
jgi:hypothetical protein